MCRLSSLLPANVVIFKHTGKKVRHLHRTIQRDMLLLQKKGKEMSEDKHTVCIQYYHSPCGKIILAEYGNRLCMCDWGEMPCAERNKRCLQRALNGNFEERPSRVLQLAKEQLDEYFAGRRRTFDLPLLTVGTNFQKSVWQALQEIPYGETRSYMQIAKQIGNPRGVRAVAQAIGSNRISVIIPCHRVIGANHSLTGFAGGLAAKRTLLEIEGSLVPHLITPTAK